MRESAASMRGVDLLFDPATVRARAHFLLQRARRGESEFFSVNDAALEPCARAVLEVTRANYPDLEVPFHSRWRHFKAGGLDRAQVVLGPIDDPLERARCAFDLVVTSVLLDAGAGAAWSYTDHAHGAAIYSRSEGLALASLGAFQAGLFSSEPAHAVQADAAGLAALDVGALGRAFQVSTRNPLSGLQDRGDLLRKLGLALRSQPEYFGEQARVGYLVDYLLGKASQGTLPAAQILSSILWSLKDAWPLRFTLNGIALGDCWRHPALLTNDATCGLIPFHKLSQWLSYSLVEPLQALGVKVVGLEQLTGLPEYRNGGLLLDAGVLSVRDPAALEHLWSPSDTFIVEWRALTVALLDEIGAQVRQLIGRTEAQFPLARVLEGGTWHTGRKLARERRPDGAPPLRIALDATVF